MRRSGAALEMARSRETRNEHEAIWALRTLAVLDLDRREIEAAARRVAEVAEIASGRENPLFEAVVGTTRGEVLRAEGDGADGRDEIVRAQRALEALGFANGSLRLGSLDGRPSRAG